MADTPSTSLCPVCQQERARKQWSPAQWTHWDPWRTGRSCCVLCEDSPKTWLTSMPPRITQEDYAALRQRWREDGGGSQPSCHLQRSRSRSGSDRRGTSAPRLPGTRRSRSRSRGARRRTSATRLSTSSQLADSKYRDQLIHAYQFLQEAIGSVIKLDELMNRPGSEPLRALLKGPHAQQLQDVDNARTALEIVTTLCCEEGLDVTAQTATAEGCVGHMRCPIAVDPHEHFADFETTANRFIENWRKTSYNQQKMRPDVQGTGNARIAWATDKARYNALLPDPVYDLDFDSTAYDLEKATVTIPVSRQELLVLLSP